MKSIIITAVGTVLIFLGLLVNRELGADYSYDTLEMVVTPLEVRAGENITVEINSIQKYSGQVTGHSQLVSDSGVTIKLLDFSAHVSAGTYNTKSTVRIPLDLLPGSYTYQIIYEIKLGGYVPVKVVLISNEFTIL